MIRLESISFAYPAGEPVLKDLDLVLKEGDRIGIMGANGSGKTTLLHIIMGLLKPTDGSVFLFDRPRYSEGDFMDARRRMGFVFQDADDQLFCPTVAEDVAFGPRNLGRTPEESHQILHRTLDMLDIGHLEHRVTYQLSGGEKKLVALATALAMEPDILIMDEPTTGLTEEASSILENALMDKLVQHHGNNYTANW